MAAILKCWREAATLVLIAKSRHKVRGSFISAENKIPHDSNDNTLSLYNYDILTLKRSTKSTFMPDLYVFPGGIADDTDFSPEWLDIYKNTKLQKWLEFVKRGGEGPYMFNRQRSAEYECVPSELAFRICAIRETFEESGVLLVRHTDQCINNLLKMEYDHKNPISGMVFPLDDSLTETWRKRVDKDSTEFLRMCRELNVIPDVWSLVEWSNWLTPTLLEYTAKRKGRRYDTAFFMCVLDDVPIAKHDTKETVHSQWCPPDDLIRSYISSKGGLAPPQVCELSRLLNFKDVNDLHLFSWHRSMKRVDRWFPAATICEDGIISFYPGDELYPQSPDFEGIHPLPQVTDTMKEMAQKCGKRNRLEIPFSKPPGLVGYMNCNIDPLDGQVKPITELDFLGLQNEKL